MADGYDAIAERYAAWAAAGRDSREVWLNRLTDGLPDGVSILDLGCGNGVPTARDLAVRFHVTGVDVSARQIDAARTAVPAAHFVVADMTSVLLPEAAFDAAIALYSMIHVRLAELPDLLRRVHGWLRRGGRFLVTLGTSAEEGIEPDWLGVQMFFAGQTPAANLATVRSAGFEVLSEAIETTTEPEGDVRFHWILARRP